MNIHAGKQLNVLTKLHCQKSATFFLPEFHIVYLNSMDEKKIWKKNSLYKLNSWVRYISRQRRPLYGEVQKLSGSSGEWTYFFPSLLCFVWAYTLMERFQTQFTGEVKKLPKGNFTNIASSYNLNPSFGGLYSTESFYKRFSNIAHLNLPRAYYITSGPTQLSIELYIII